MEESSYDEEEVIETWYEDEDEEERDVTGVLEGLHASFTSFQSLAKQRKEKRQQPFDQPHQHQHISPRQMTIETSSTFETLYSDYEEDVDRGVYEDYDHCSDGDDDDDDLLLGVRNQMQQLFRERKAQAVRASFVSLVSVDSQDEEFEEQVIERWFGRDTLPGTFLSRAPKRFFMLAGEGVEHLDAANFICCGNR